MSKEIATRLRKIEAFLGQVLSLLTELKSAGSPPLDVDEAATYCHFTKSHLYQLTSKKLIPHFKPAGKKIFFRKEDLDAYLLRHRRAAAEELDEAAANYVVNRAATETVT